MLRHCAAPALLSLSMLVGFSSTAQAELSGSISVEQRYFLQDAIYSS